MARRIWVQVKPLAKKAALIPLGGDVYQASVHAPAQDGKANQALIELLSEYFVLAKSRIKILRGHRARKKLIELG